MWCGILRRPAGRLRCASSVRRACGRELELRGIPFFYQQFRNTMFRKGAVSPWMADMRRLRPFLITNNGNAQKSLFPDSGTPHRRCTAQSACRTPQDAPPQSNPISLKKPSAISGKGRSLRGTTFVYHSTTPNRILSANGDRAGILTAVQAAFGMNSVRHSGSKATFHNSSPKRPRSEWPFSLTAGIVYSSLSSPLTCDSLS